MNTLTKNYRRILKELIEERKKNPITFSSSTPQNLKVNELYVVRMGHSFYRTVGDIVNYFEKKGVSDLSAINILEIGAFRGIVSIALAKLGFNVTATELPEFLNDEQLLKEYKADNIDYYTVNLKDYSLPFKDKNFDMVIICETLEHLNFNPLPVINEINRVLKNEGALYLSLPNVTSLYNRADIIMGKSFYNPIDDFFRQLDGSKGMVAGLHWREYSKNEIKEMLHRLGFNISSHYYYSKYDDVPLKDLGFKNWLKTVLFALNTSLKENQTAIALKKNHYTGNFYFSDSVKL